jgi:hypothetical protein
VVVCLFLTSVTTHRSFGHAWILEQLGAAVMPFFSCAFLLYSITGGWNTDLADPGYKVMLIVLFQVHRADNLHRRSFKYFHSIGQLISCDTLSLDLVEPCWG